MQLGNSFEAINQLSLKAVIFGHMQERACQSNWCTWSTQGKLSQSNWCTGSTQGKLSQSNWWTGFSQGKLSQSNSCTGSTQGTLRSCSIFPVRSQISTITVATFNTTLASFNVGYADFFSEHMRKLCSQVPIPEMPHEPLACANLPRSLTDSCINYSYLEDTEHIDGTNNFVHKNGMLDLSVRGSTFPNED